MSRKDYTKFSKTEPIVIQAEPIEEPVTLMGPIQVVPTVGIITNCTKLNIRKEPAMTAEILCVVDSRTEVIVNLDESTDDFYKVCTAAGVEGYCVKHFITVKP